MTTKKHSFHTRRRKTSIGTIREKVRRWWCHNCERAFTPKVHRILKKTHNKSIIYKAAQLYFNSEASYRAVSRQLKVRPQKIFQWTDFLGETCKSFTEVQKELNPKWSEYLLADGKFIFINKDEYALLLTIDAQTQDIPYAMLFESESYESWHSVFTSVRDDLNYPIKGIISDGNLGLLKAAKKVFPRVAHQLCIRHVYAYYSYRLKYQFKGPKEGIEPFLDITHKLLYARNKEHLEILLDEYSSQRQYLIDSGLEAEIVNFESKFEHLWIHFDHPGMPRTNNIVEGVISQLSRKITDTDGFSYFSTAWNSLKLLIMNYRFHKFSCSRIKGHNGRSPLELAGVNTNGINWIKFSQKKQH